MSVLDGPGEGTWSVFAQKVVEERDEARHTLGRIAAVLFSSRAPLDDEELVEAMLMVIRERDEARHALHEILAVIHRDGGHYTGNHGISKSVADAHAAWAAVVREREEAQAELAFLRKEYGDADANTLTRDALELKLQVMEQQRDEERKQYDALRAVWIAASDWLTRLGEKGHRYHDGVPGDLMDAVDAADDAMTGKP